MTRDKGPTDAPWLEMAGDGGARIPYRVTGQGRPLLCIPGLANSSRLFGTLPRSLARLGYSVCVFDPRGLGRSRDDSGPWTVDAALSDIASLLDGLSWQRAFLLGTSMGGKIALDFASRHPKRVEGGFLFGTEASGSPRARAIYDWFESLFRHTPLPEIATALRPFLFGASFQQKHSGFVSDILRAVRFGERERETALRQVAAMRSSDLVSRLEAVKAPFVLHAGVEDSLVAVEDVRVTAERLPHGEFRRIESAGHSMLAEQASACLEALSRA